MYEVGDLLSPPPENEDGRSALEVTFSGPKFDLLGLFSFEELWSPDIVTNNSQHRYRPQHDKVSDPFEFADGALRIWARRVVDPSANAGQPWASGVLSSRENVDLRLSQWGFMEIEMRLPKGEGMWPAWWFLPYWPVGTPWPEDFHDFILPEVDAMESAHTNIVNMFKNTIHTYNQVESTDDRVLTSSAHEHKCPAGYDFTRDFHKFGIYRTPTSLYFTLDRKVVNIVPHPIDKLLEGDWVMLLNLAVGGDYPGSPPETMFARSFDIRSIYNSRLPFVSATEVDSDDTAVVPTLTPVPSGPNADLIRVLQQMEAETHACVREKFAARIAALS